MQTLEVVRKTWQVFPYSPSIRWTIGVNRERERERERESVKSMLQRNLMIYIYIYIQYIYIYIYIYSIYMCVYIFRTHTHTHTHTHIYIYIYIYLYRIYIHMIDMYLFAYLGSSVSFTENEINVRLAKAWTAIDRLSIIWKSNLSDKIKRNFFQAVVVSILLYGCTT